MTYRSLLVHLDPLRLCVRAARPQCGSPRRSIATWSESRRPA